MPTDGQGRDRADVLPAFDLGKVRSVDWKELAIRFMLGAAVSVVAGVVSKGIGVRLGGVFLAFPAILPASLTIVEEQEGVRKADRDAIGATLGAVALVVFAAVGESMFKRVQPGGRARGGTDRLGLLGAHLLQPAGSVPA